MSARLPGGPKFLPNLTINILFTIDYMIPTALGRIREKNPKFTGPSPGKIESRLDRGCLSAYISSHPRGVLTQPSEVHPE
jgi:hypothetical protein